ncbi:MAG TPA: ABC transporter substrate-binding protein [Acidimicrobiales bacterium]|nr:ABC transporter substrate-binding protein [Acidimicrobiales bacterium]
MPLIRLAAGPDGFPSPVTGVRLAGIQASLVFDTLVWKSPSGAIAGWLARSWQESADGTTWTFTLHPGVTWQDGTPMTAADVAFTYNYLISGPGHAAAGIFGSVFIGDFVGVTAPDASTVVFQFKRPWAPFLTNIAGLVLILPQHIWSTVTNPATFTGSSSMVGTGPYRLASFDRATGSADFVANDRYFMGPPKVRRIEFVPAPDPLLSLKQGDIDAANLYTEDQLPTEVLTSFSPSKYGTVTGTSDWDRALYFNLDAGFPYNNVTFRQAVDDAVNRPALVSTVLFGHGMPGSSGGLAPSNPYFAPGLPADNFDPTGADSLLDSIGLTRPAGGGMRQLPGGHPFTVTLQTSTEFSNETAQLVAEDLHAVGLAVDVDQLDATTADKNAATGNYQMALVGTAGPGEDPDLLLRINLSPKTIATTSKSWGYDNPTVETLGNDELFSPSMAARTADFRQIQQAVADDVPFIPLYFPTPEAIFNKTVFDQWYFTPGGFRANATGVLNKAVFVTGRKGGV